MAANKAWKVIYHFEAASTHKGAWDSPQQVTVIAADSKEATILSVLTSNGISRPGATVVLDHISTVSLPGGADNVLS